MAAPLEKSNELVDKINALLDSETITEFGLKQIEHEAKKLMSVDSAAAHLVLGMLSALKNDKTELVKHHDLALKLGCDRFLGFRNFSVSLANIGFFSDALEYAREAYRIEKSPEIFRSLIGLNFNCARFEEALSYLLELERLGMDTFEDLPSKIKVEELTSFMKRHALRDSDLANITSAAESILHKDKLEVKSFAFDVFNENGDEWLSIEISVPVPPKAVAALNISLAEELVESETVNFLLDKVSCSFKPYQKGAVGAACL